MCSSINSVVWFCFPISLPNAEAGKRTLINSMSYAFMLAKQVES